MLGMACDNVASFEVVLPNSTVVEATQSSQPDLYRALRGGGTYFGIITMVSLRTFATGAVWDTKKSWKFDTSTSQQMFSAQEQRIASAAPDMAMSTLAVFWQRDSSDFEVSERVVYAPRRKFDMQECTPLRAIPAYTDLPTQESAFCTNISSMAASMDNGNPSNHYNLWASMTVLNDCMVNRAISDIFRDEIQALGSKVDLSKIFAVVVFNGLTSRGLEKMTRDGGNSLGFQHNREQPLTIVNFTLRWNTTGREELLDDFMKRLLSKASEVVIKMSARHP